MSFSYRDLTRAVALACAIVQRFRIYDLSFPRAYLMKPAACKVWATTVTLVRLTPSIWPR
jgi:hypothetical protein